MGKSGGPTRGKAFGSRGEGGEAAGLLPKKSEKEKKFLKKKTFP